MLYLLDANTLIDAKRDYFQMERVPEFWEWLVHLGASGIVKIPVEIYEEFEDSMRPDGSRDELAKWASSPDVKKALLLDEDAEPHLVAEVVETGYAADLSDAEIESIGRDPFLIARALVDPTNRTVVTTEVSKPSRKRANRQVPDVCKDLGVRCINGFQLLSELDFRTSWK
ncbi:MAG: DUF4411 family protein [Candidatus Competibacteraceae bacterium]